MSALEAAGERVVLEALSGEVVPLDGGQEVDAASVTVEFVPGRKATVTLGPAPVNWHVTGVAIVRGGERLATRPFPEPVGVLAGQKLRVTIDPEVTS